MLYSSGPIILDLGELLNLKVSLPLRWYGLLTGLGFLGALFLIQQLVKDKISEIQKQNLFDLLFYCFIGGIIGARLWFAILNFKYFAQNPAEVFFIWQGGQSIQGGFMGGFLAGYLFYKLNSAKLLPFWETADLIAVALPFAQAIGRWGNFFNIEAFGKPTNLPWALYVPPALRPEKYFGDTGFHPTFAYESLYLILVTVFLIWLFQKKNLPNGFIFFLYLILYSFGRFFLEFLRLDSLFIGIFPAAQVICIITIIIGLIGLANCLKSKTKLI